MANSSRHISWDWQFVRDVDTYCDSLEAERDQLREELKRAQTSIAKLEERFAYVDQKWHEAANKLACAEAELRRLQPRAHKCPHGVTVYPNLRESGPAFSDCCSACWDAENETEVENG